jgi:hypothetical protein
MPALTESVVESAALTWLESLGWTVTHGPEIAPGEPTLKTIARELTESVRRNVSIDWTVRENVQAQMRVRVRRILRKYGYPPDKQEQATRTVLAQAEVLSHAWAVA